MQRHQRHINVDATSRRCIDVDAKLHKRHVSAVELVVFYELAVIFLSIKVAEYNW